MLKKKVYTGLLGINLHYYDNEESTKKAIVFLHGWGANAVNLSGIYNYLSDSYRIIAIDIPGFGETERPKDVWGSPEYAHFIALFLDSIGLDSYSLVGHSFGGKISCYLCLEFPDRVNKIVLIAASCLRNKRNLLWYIKVYLYKLMKFFCLKFKWGSDFLEKMRNKSGSDDYKESKLMRDILVKVVNEDMTLLLPKILAPVFIYWGEKDEAAPVWMAKKIKSLISDSGLYIVKNGSHFPFLEDNRILSIIKEFI